MLSPCALLQLYCCRTVITAHAAHSEKGGNYTNVQYIMGKHIVVSMYSSWQKA